MKKSFMTRVLAVSLSAAMAFSMSSASNLMTASAASTVNLKTTFKTLKVNQTYKMVLKNNTLNWKITKVTTTDKKICTVYGKTASSVMLKGKGVGRAKITVKVKTTKRKYPKNIKNMKCTVNVKAAETPSEVTFGATAAANSNTEVRVNFTQAVDAAAVENFKITEENVSVSKAELSDDKKSVVLTIAGAEYSKNYELTVTGIKVGGKVQADQKLAFTTPSPEVTNPVSLTAERAILKSDGQDTTTLTFKITDAQGNPLTDKGMEVRFTTNLGKFATDRVSIQNGEAKVMYTSEALSENHTAMITATIIEAPADTKLIGTYASTSISLMPNPDELDDSSVGATITSITAPTADRVYAYFNKEVNAEDFKVGDEPNTKKFTCTIQSGLDNGYGEGATKQEHRVVGILPVENDPKALQLLVDQPMVDNSIVKVDFENKTTTGGIYIPKNTVYCKLTDARQPAVVSINAVDQRTIEIEFSEAVLPQAKCDTVGGNITQNEVNWQKEFAADNLDNYQIDGVQLSNEGYWGKIDDDVYESEKVNSGSDSSVTLKKDSEKLDGEDGDDAVGSIKVGRYGKRNVVTIKLNRQKYLQAGRTHRISIANVGDWAAKTDKERNIVSTEGFDFDVQADTTTPTFTATAMSPEQYLLEFSSDIVTVSADDRIRTSDSQNYPSVIKMEVKNANGSWSEISNGSANETGKNPLRITRVKEGDTVTNKYLVEVQRDWTEVYNTSSTRDNYYRHEYRLTIDSGKILNPVNGNKNATLNVELTDDVIRSVDDKSPAIEKIQEAEGNLGSYNVFMTEPVKLSAKANIEGLTPSQTQQQLRDNNDTENRMGVPAPEAQFVNVEDRRTIEGVIEEHQFVDAYDQIINVSPASELSNGEWDLIVRSISDDVGNTAPTLTQRISVDNPVSETNFRVMWAAVGYDESAYTNNSAAYDEAIAEANVRGTGNCIYVKFNKPVTLFGSSTNAQSISNYTLNGSQLPTGTEIRAHIQGYDRAIGTNVDVVDSITIVLPRDRFAGGNSIYTVSNLNTMLNISKTITCSTTNEVLDNAGMLRIPFQYGDGSNDAKYTGYTKTTPYIRSLNQTTDAVWGNDISEQYNRGKGSITDPEEYYEKFKAALEDEKYRKVVLDTDLNLGSTMSSIVNVFGRSQTLRINRVVDLDLNGHTITGNVVITTDSLAESMSIYSSTGTANPGRIVGKATNKATDAALTVNAGRAGHIQVLNVEVSNGGTDINDSVVPTVVALNDVWLNSFEIGETSTIYGSIEITDSNGFGLVNNGTVTGNVFINGTGVANLRGTYKNIAINVNQAADVRCDGAIFEAGVKINVAASNAKLFLEGVTVDPDNKPVITASAKNVNVYVGNDGNVEKFIFQNDANGTFVQINDKGNKNDTNVFEKPDVVKPSPVAYALKNVKLLPDGFPDADDNGNVVITAGAISTGSLKIRETITAQELQGAKDTPLDGGGVRLSNANVSISMNSSRLVDLNNGVITLKEKWEDQADSVVDVITVVLKYDNQSCTRTIRVRRS